MPLPPEKPTFIAQAKAGTSLAISPTCSTRRTFGRPCAGQDVHNRACWIAWPRAADKMRWLFVAEIASPPTWLSWEVSFAVVAMEAGWS
jgi:hypothetical protein